MRKAFRIVGTVLSILAITLFLDAIATATVLLGLINTDRDAAEAGNLGVYIGAPHHHDIIPGIETPRVWGRVIYPWKADKYGLRAGTCAPGEPEKAWPAIFVIGDSFVEAVGSSYEQSFTGLMACDAARQKKAVWNLGVASYSPIIYWKKIKAAAARIGVRPAEVYVFLDLSDIDDDANVYREAPDGRVLFQSRPEPSADNWQWDPVQWLVKHFTSARLIYDTYISASFTWDKSFGRDRALAVRPEAPGEMGQARAGGCGRGPRQAGGALPRMAMPRHAGRVSVARQHQGERPRQPAGSLLA